MVQFESIEKQLHDLKIQMAYEEGLVKDPRFESTNLRKKLHESKANLWRA